MKDMLRLVPILIPAQLCFGALMNCMMFYYQHQACQMDVRVPWADPLDPKPTQLNGSIYNVADCLAVVMFTPIVIILIMPAIERVQGRPLDFGFRYTVGVILGSASVFFAGIIEILRRRSPKLHFVSDCAPDGITMSSIGAIWMVIPYALMGMGEVWAMPTIMHLAYNQAPPAARTLTSIMGFFLLGVSSSLFSIIVTLCSRWSPDNLNEGHLEYAYLANWIVAALFLAVFFFAYRRFEQKTFD
jgi:dipeptide/tripeptide permease